MTPSCLDLYFLQTMCPSLNCFVLSFALNLIWLSEATFIFFPPEVWANRIYNNSNSVDACPHCELNRSLFLLNFITKCIETIFQNAISSSVMNTSIQTDLWGCSFASIYYFVSCQLFLIKERKYLNFKTLPVSKLMVLIHPKNVIFHYSSIATINYHEMPYVYQRRYYKFVRPWFLTNT